VEVNLCVSDSPYSDVADPLGDIPGLFPACTVTRAMSRRETQKTSEEHIPDEPPLWSVSQVEQEAVHL